MSRCRSCGTLRTKGDPCPGADCSSRDRLPKLRARTLPVTATTTHGYHAPATSATRFVCDYDQPIRATRWVRAAS
jgi:hypothetical protein